MARLKAAPNTFMLLMLPLLWQLAWMMTGDLIDGSSLFYVNVISTPPPPVLLARIFCVHGNCAGREIEKPLTYVSTWVYFFTLLLTAALLSAH